MGLQLHLSASATELLSQLREELHEAQRRSLTNTRGVPAPIPVLVPASTIAEWLQIQLARERGISMGFEFLQPGPFFRQHLSRTEQAKAFSEASAFWTAGQLRWALLPHVDTFAAQLGQDPDAPLTSRARFAFAGLLASTLEGYGRFRPEWPERWAADRSVLDADPAANAAESWQRAVWRTLAEASAVPHPATVLRQGRSSSKSGTNDTRQPLFVVATEALDPLTLETLAWLDATSHAVSLHVLLPSLGFLGDVGRRKALSALSPQVDDDSPPWTAHPLLVSLGQQSVRTFLLLGEVSPDYAEWPAASEPPEAGDVPVLNRLQLGIRQEVPPADAPRSSDAPDLRPILAPDDTSLRVHACHSPRRELEVLRDELLRAFAQLPDLRPEDVLIATPAFDVYAPLVEGVLKAGPHPLPVRQTAVPAREANPIAGGLIALLRLAMGRCAASELIELLNLPALQAHLEADSEAVAHLADLIRNSGLTHGCDAAHRDSADDTGTWRAALDRILAGMWFGPVDVVTDASGTSLHPVSGVLHGDDALDARFAALLTELAVQLGTWRTNVPAREWGLRLTSAADLLLYSEELDDDAVALRRLLSELDTVAAETPLDAATLLDWLEEHLENATSLRTSVSGDILFGRLDQLHALPCRVLAIVGLQDGAFPRASRRVAWDLLTFEPQRWDNDPRTHDRQLFLDCVLAPTDRLILTAPTRSVRTGHDGPFSSCVAELLRVTAQTVRPSSPEVSIEEQLVVRHRIHPFSPEYFNGDGLPPSFDAASARIAGDLQSGGAIPAKPFFVPATLGGAAPAGEPQVISLEALAEFWKDPARAWARALQIELPRDEVDDSVLDACAVTLDSLQQYAVQDAILDAEISDAAVETSLIGRLIADRALPPGALGSLLCNRHRGKLQVIVATLRPLLPQVEELAVAIAVRPEVRITGQVRLVRGDDGVLAYRPGKYDKPRHQLLPFIQSLAATVSLRRPIGAHIIGLNAKQNGLRSGLSPEEASTVLGALVNGFVEGHWRPLPFAPATSAKIAASLEQGKDAGDALEAALDVWYGGGWNESGEGLEPAAALAWRDAAPFSGNTADEWVRWAKAVAAPLQRWWKG